MISVLTTTGHVLVAISIDPNSRVRDIATTVNVTERTVIISIAQLIEAGMLTVEKTGRRNTYTVDLEQIVLVGPKPLKIRELVELATNESKNDTNHE